MTIAILILGFVLLIIGANLLVESTVKVAKKFKISTMIISMTIIAIGTSIPELAVACFSATKGSQIALSNNIGSIVSNVGLGLGFTALICTIDIRKTIKAEVIKMLIVQLCLILFLIQGGNLDLTDGIIFLIAFIIYMVSIIRKARKIVSIEDEKDIIKEEIELIDKTEKAINNSVITLSIFIVIGIAFVALGGNLVVDAATQLARLFGLSEAFIGATIVAIGTNLPELVTAIIASRKKEFDIIIGNIIGSGVTNILLIIGIASIIHPIQYTNILLFQSGFMLLFGLLMYVIAKKQKAERLDGVTLILTYILFVVSSFILSKS